MKSEINTGKITGKVRIRILRPWRGYAVGAVIKPPGALAQIVLQTKDQLGNPVAEVVQELEPEQTPELEPRVAESSLEVPLEVPEEGAPNLVKGPDARPRKNRR